VITVPDLSGIVPGSTPVHEQQETPSVSPTLVDLGCPHCAGIFKVTGSMEGQQVACPHCQGVVTVPMLTPGSAPEEVAAAHEELPPAVSTGPAVTLPQPSAFPAQPSPLPSPIAPFPIPSTPPSYQPTAVPSPSPALPLDRPAAVVIPTEDGGYVAVREPVKTIGRPGQEIELRQLTVEEKRRRRQITNIIVISACMVILLITFLVLKSR
jgi:hypothetical protein